jgi:hypothetical protein
MNSWVFAGLVSAGVVVVSLSGACAGERKITVANASSQTIVELYASPPELGDYGVNLLGVAKIRSGQTTTVRFDDTGACAFDFQAVTGDDDMFTARNVDVCKSPEVTLPQP